MGDTMKTLVKQIRGSPYANGIFAWTSMYDLCIVQTEVEYPYDGPYLRVSPQQNGKVEFRYVDTLKKKRNQWVRLVSAGDAFDRLRRFFDDLHWFTELKPDHAQPPSLANAVSRGP